MKKRGRNNKSSLVPVKTIQMTILVKIKNQDFMLQGHPIDHKASPGL